MLHSISQGKMFEKGKKEKEYEKKKAEFQPPIVL